MYSPRPPLGQCSHHLIQEVLLLLRRHLWPPAAKVQRVVPLLLVVGTQVEAQWQCLQRVDTRARGVQGELANWNTHAVNAQVTKPQDTGPIGDDSYLNVMRPVLNDGVEVAAILEREVHALWLGVEFGPALAGLADGWGIDERGEFLHGSFVSPLDPCPLTVTAYLHIASQQPVEQVHVGVPQHDQVLVFLNRRLPRVQDSQAPLALVLEALHTRWSQTVRLQVLPRLERVGGIVVRTRRDAMTRCGVVVLGHDVGVGRRVVVGHADGCRGTGCRPG